MPEDYVSQILSRTPVSGGSGMDHDVSGHEDVSGAEHELISGLQSVGALSEVGARTVRKMLGARKRSVGAGLPSPPFAMSQRETERRAPLGFVEDGTGRNYFTLAASIGAITTMRAKVSRVAHVDRLLVVPSAAGAVFESIKVGDEEQTLASGVPVELYGTSALTDTVPDNFSPIGPGLDFIVTVRNTTASAITGTIGTKCACKR